MFPKFSQRAFPWTVQKNLTQFILDFKMKQETIRVVKIAMIYATLTSI